MEKIKAFFKSLFLRLSISGNLLLFSMITESTKSISAFFVCLIPIVLLWKVGVLKLCWKIIKGFFSIFTSSGSSSSQEDDGEPEQIISAYEEGSGENRQVYFDTTKKRRINVGWSGDKLSGYTSSTISVTRGRPGVSAQGYGTYVYDVKGHQIDMHSF